LRHHEVIDPAKEHFSGPNAVELTSEDVVLVHGLPTGSRVASPINATRLQTRGC
jgi:hypothetical protein